MLTDLHIRDFVIAKQLHLEFERGLTVLTGETGAGKSILIGALGLVLGDRADTQSVRAGTDKAEISAVFDVDDNAFAQSWLQTNDLDSHHECVVRRVIMANGRSKAFINGKPAPIQQLRELGQRLVDIHGQHEHQAMVIPSVQLSLLDDYGSHGAVLKRVSGDFAAWKKAQSEFDALTDALAERTARLELLRFQTEELAKLAASPGEFETLSEEQFRLSHVSTLAEASTDTLDALTADASGCQSALAKARRALAHVKTIDTSLEEYDALLDSAEIQILEAVSGLNRYADSLDMDPKRRDFVEERLDQISALAKKHRVPPEALAAHVQTLHEELHTLGNAEESLLELEQQLQVMAQAYQKSAAKLSSSRVKAAKKMAADISGLVMQLGMPDSKFSIDVSPNDDKVWRANGLDAVQFMIQANPGEPARPVAKVASGGELSRISLAVQVVSAASLGATCMVFDEVDAGVGGAVADMIGQRLQELGSTRQILSVTHLPQVACHGHQHFKVSKSLLDKRTHSQVQQLTGKERTEELARMLGGAKLTATTRRHADELLAQAKKFGKTIKRSA